MSFTESTTAFMADFGVTCTFGAVTAKVIMDHIGEEVLNGRGSSVNHQMRFWTAQLPNLTFGSSVTVAGVQYRVLTVQPSYDGATSTAQLEAV